MKKRTILSIIITLVCIIATNKFWLVFKPINVSFDIKGNSKPFIEVCLDKKRVGREIDLDQNNRFEVSIKRAKFPKHLEIVFNDASFALGGGGGKTLDISEIQLKNKNYKLEDFVAKNADFKIKNNTLIIYPKDSYFSVLYNKPLKLRASVRFEFELFVIISVLSFLIAYKLVDYIADFKTIKKHSRIDIVFLAIFFLLLFIPASHIDTETKVAENRVLAKWQPLFLKDRKINYNFGNDFNNWFNDRFNLRSQLISLCYQGNYILRDNYVEGFRIHFYKKTGWMFINGSLDALQPLKQKEVEKIASNLNRLNQYLANKSIKLYVLIPPCAESYYKKHSLILKKKPVDWTVQLKDYTKNKYGFEIIYPEKILRENEKGNYIYYKTDTHMTDYGNYIMYSDLIRIMSEDFPKLKITPLNQFNVYKRTLVRSGYRRTFDNGYNYLHSKIHNEALLTPKYVYYDYKYPNDIQIVENTHTNTKGNYRLLILGDSFQENLVYFLNTSFHNIEKYRTNIAKMGPKRNYEMEIEAYYKIIDEFKPDAILLIKNSKDIRTFLDMYPKEGR